MTGFYSLSGAHWREPAERLPRSKNLLHARMVRRYVCVARVVSRITKHAIGASDALAPPSVDTIARSVGSGNQPANEQAGKRYHQQGPAGGGEIGGERPRPRERRRGQFRECAIGRERGEGATIKGIKDSQGERVKWPPPSKKKAGAFPGMTVVKQSATANISVLLRQMLFTATAPSPASQKVFQ